MHPDNVGGDRNERDDRYQEAWTGFAPGRWQ
jgi:hypothetical protein